MFLRSVNPVNGTVEKKYKLDTEEQVSEKIDKASLAWAQWKKLPSVKEKSCC